MIHLKYGGSLRGLWEVISEWKEVLLMRLGGPVLGPDAFVYI